MKKSVIFIGILFFAWLAFLELSASAKAPVAELPALPVVIEGVQTLYRKIETLELSFSQSTRLELLDRVVSKRGTMIFKRPGKFYIHYETPPLKDYISDGAHLWVTVEEEKKVYETLPKKEELDEQARLFLAGFGDLEGSFLVSPLSERDFNKSLFKTGKSAVYLQLIPKADSSFFTWIAIAVNPETFHVEEMSLFNRSQNVSHYEFSNMVVNPEVPNSRFTLSKEQKALVEK